MYHLAQHNLAATTTIVTVFELGNRACTSLQGSSCSLSVSITMKAVIINSVHRLLLATLFGYATTDHAGGDGGYQQAIQGI